VARRVGLVVFVAALATAGPAPAADARPGVSLQRYLASMSWPVRASILRVETLTGAIDNWVAQGDPPFLGEIAEYCKNFLAVESRGRVLATAAPQRLRTAHGGLVDAYSAARRDCVHVRLTALATRDAGRSTTAARAEFRRFQHTTLRSFSRAVTTWGSALVRELRAAGFAVPGWLLELA